MSQLSLTFPGDTRTEAWPERVPDLYRGEPLVVVAKLGAAATSAYSYPAYSYYPSYYSSGYCPYPTYPNCGLY